MREREILEPAGDALLALAGERAWKTISLRDIADRAGVALADLYAAAPSRMALLGSISARFDLAALRSPGEGGEDPHDRLFEAVMARIEAMEPHRAALTAIALKTGRLPLLPHLPLTARAILEGAGLDASPPRVLAMTAVWARIVQVWRDDEGALNRTMAEVDQRLKSLRAGLKRVRAGF